MAEKCIYCGNRPGTRECPALGGLICSVCCGEHRGVEINCPPDCRYFQEGEKFQQEKRAEPYRDAWLNRNRDLFEDENYDLLETLSMIEKVIYFEYRKDNLLTDKQIINGLIELKKRFKPIEIPSKWREFTEFAHETISPLVEKGRISPETIVNALDRFEELANEFSDGSRGLVQGVVGRVEQDYDVPKEEGLEEAQNRESLIITPDQLKDN